jgi:putative addiction module killer protein
MPIIEIRHYQSTEGEQPFTQWLQDLRDQQARARIRIRLDRLSLGNFGDCEPVGGGVIELRIDWGPGYRVYYAMIGRECVLLLCGGDKRKQSADIDRALEYLKDYKERAGTS